MLAGFPARAHVPFSLTTPSVIGSVYLSADGTGDGRACDMEGDSRFFHLFDEPYVTEVAVGLDMSHAVAGVARNYAGVFSLTLSWAPATVREGLRDLIGGGRVTATFNHPGAPDGTIALRVEVLRVTPANDTSQFEETDPVEGLNVVMVSHGEPD
jgi:hypothetical protein